MNRAANDPQGQAREQLEAGMRAATIRILIGASLCLCFASSAFECVFAQAPASLSGVVSSDREGVMEGANALWQCLVIEVKRTS
jgi:hypothetical protein